MPTNAQNIEEFIQGKENSATTGANIFVEDFIIYSYGKHWPLAMWKDDFAYVNESSRSVTTSKHRTQLMNALHYAGKGVRMLPLEELQQMIKDRDESNNSNRHSTGNEAS